MDIHTIRQQLRMRSVYDLPLRVTFYARVSSESDEQLNSLGTRLDIIKTSLNKMGTGPMCRDMWMRACLLPPPSGGRIFTAWCETGRPDYST